MQMVSRMIQNPVPMLDYEKELSVNDVWPKFLSTCVECGRTDLRPKVWFEQSDIEPISYTIPLEEDNEPCAAHYDCIDDWLVMTLSDQIQWGPWFLTLEQRVQAARQGFDGDIFLELITHPNS